MNMGGPLFAVRNMERSKQFYKEVLGLDLAADYGANVVLTGGLSLQTLESWAEFLDREPSGIVFGGSDAEVYFEEEDYDAFLQTLRRLDVKPVHPPLEHRWGQRAVRIYDPDRHVIEVAEPLSKVCRRFLDSGLNEEGIARRMEIPVEQVRMCLKQAR